MTLTKEQIYEQLEYVMDPELGMDILNLGLVYDAIIEEENHVKIIMTMTSMGCPMAGQIVASLKKQLHATLPVQQVDVEIVWKPQWTKDRMSRYAKIALGVHV
ncbi:MAG TPA: metal-sulfur cluster assembly factor [Paenibacillus sp.]|jgi:metal-sulfur cluster biosynthetic enzyme|uniref:DNA methyltransferase n=1 Tax=Paenibacillus selenitireducens TaxID=1324314 RepID=A0A1T2XHX3_9BACL|nr:metal-sulfur cluster assembly factor [Paenibacillus selenitireducens]OPA79306.1 DNA methyltransferase [Paenibacillus selenitireducens]